MLAFEVRTPIIDVRPRSFFSWWRLRAWKGGAQKASNIMLI
jgi:hypothetical protein